MSSCLCVSASAAYLKDCDVCPETLKALLLSTEFHTTEELLAVLPARVEAPEPAPMTVEPASTEEVALAPADGVSEEPSKHNELVSADALTADSETVEETAPVISESGSSEAPADPAVNDVEAASSTATSDEAAPSSTPSKDSVEVAVDPVA